MPIDERELRMRRVKRTMKAGASIALALAAGAFLACQRVVVRNEAQSPMGPDARRGPPPSPSADAVADVATVADAAADAATDAGADTEDAQGMVVASDAPGDIVVRSPPRGPRHHVDRDEHRRGLPVIDNLLE